MSESAYTKITLLIFEIIKYELYVLKYLNISFPTYIQKFSKILSIV